MKKGHNLPDRLVKGKSNQPRPAEPPAVSGQGGGKISTNVKDINWTPAKLRIVATILLAPMVTAIIVSFNVGNILIGLVLIGLLMFVGFIYLALRYIEQNEF
jgi:hypothetical protein